MRKLCIRTWSKMCGSRNPFSPSSSSTSPNSSSQPLLNPFWYIIVRNGTLILVYYLLSIGLTFYQNHLLKEYPFPLSIVVCHLVIKFLFASLLRLAYELWTKKFRVLLDWRVWFRQLSLVGVASGLDIGLSNWSQEFVTVSLYTMTKSTAVVFILFFALAFKLEEKHWSLIFIVSLISGGLVMFTYKSTQFHLLGFSLVLGASFMSGLRWSMAQLIMQKSKLGLQNPVDMIYHVQPWMIVAILPFALFFEGSRLSQINLTHETEAEKAAIVFTINAVLIGAVVAFFMELAEFLLVTYTSSLTLAVAGIFKEICTLGLAVIINKDQMSFINFLGLCLCLVGIGCHCTFKVLRNAKEWDQESSGHQGIGPHHQSNGHGGKGNAASHGQELKFLNSDENEHDFHGDGVPLLGNSSKNPNGTATGTGNTNRTYIPIDFGDSDEEQVMVSWNPRPR